MRTTLALALALAGCGNPPPGDDDASTPLDAAGSPDIAKTGGCSPMCSGLASHCNASGHCVGCEKDGDCAMGTYCKIVSDAVANCTPGCMSDDRCANGQKCCGGACTDVMADARNCGACGMACSGAHQSATCAAGQCAPGKCDPGWGDCNKDAKDGCEANLHADPMNCTACGAVCDIKNAYAGCSDGCYSSACKWGFDDCNMNPMDGCETSVLSDVKNCGACAKSCQNLANAAAGCVSGNCVLAQCTFGYADCDKMAANGCEVKLTTDVSNCGACGNVCAQGNICVGGGCTCPMCNIPNASAKCINNMCVFDQCNPGYANCNNNTADGCEVNIGGDSANCGACGNACQMGLVCANSMCQMGIHNTLQFVGGTVTNNPCQQFNNTGNTNWDNLGPKPWKTCVTEASKRGAMLFSNSYGTTSPGWHGHRLNGVAMIGVWNVYTSADINTNQPCIIARDRRSMINNAQLANSVVYDGMTWKYQDFGIKFYDECMLLASDAGGIILDPWTLGLGNGDNYWSTSVHTGNTYEWITNNGTSFANDNVGCNVRSSQHNCMVGYVQ
jgi:hypothetical protein